MLAVSADDDTLTRIAPTDVGFEKPDTQDLGGDFGDALTVTSVGGTVVVLDSESGALQVLGGPDVDLPTGSVLQTPGPDASSVLVATSDRLLEIDLETGDEATIADGVTGRPTPPVRLGACQYGAWSGGLGAVATHCGDEQAVTNQLGTESNDLVFRVNRGEILLNDRATGAAWDIDSDEPTRLDNWDAYKDRATKNDEDEEDEQEDLGDRRPPEAKPDDLGARLGRTTVLHPLDNDTAPEGRLLAIRSVQEVSGSEADVTISPDGQTVQIRLPDDAATTTFRYSIDDGRDVSDSAMVTVTPRADSVNAPPQLREGYEPRVWTVPSGGTLDVPVLPDWRDKQDGDPLSLESAKASGGDRTGAVARTTASGRIRFTAPARAGLVSVDYVVTDGFGGSVPQELKFQVQDKKDRRAYAATAEPDVVAGQVGKPITIRPLANDLPGSDPVTPSATMELAGRVAEIGGAEVATDLVDGTITFRSTQAKTFFLDYGAKFGNAPFDEGRIRVDVRPAQRPPREPVAVPDSVRLYGQAATLVDVLANDIDPTGGMLVVQEAKALADNQLDVAIVDGRWLRVSARQGMLQPNPQIVRYFISNGTRSGIQGEVVVTWRPAPEDNSPVTEVDRVTVRAGGAASIPVLDNDFSPAGDELTLVSNVAGETAGELDVQPPGEQRLQTGDAYVAGRFVRYVAPQRMGDAETFSVRYVASSAAGETTPGQLEITVVPGDRRNQPPEPPSLEGRVVAGDTVKLKVPGAGIDPDGDPVTLTGVSTAPALGRIVKFGANSLHYQAYPGSVGTDEFGYTVTDQQGATASGTVRVAVVPPGTPQPPLAVPDTVTVEAGRTAQVEALANDLIAAGDQVSIELVDPPEGVELATPQGPVLIDAPSADDGRNVEVVYRITNGLDSSQSAITLRTASPYNNPPVVFDAFGDADDGDTVTVDVLETAYDPDGRTQDLRVAKVSTPPGVASSIDGGTVTVARGDQPRVYPYRVVDGDGGASTASLYVPPLDAGAPYLKPGALIQVDSGGTVSEDLADYVVNPGGGPVSFTLKDRIWSSPQPAVRAEITDDGTFDVSATDDYAGPAAVVFEVTTGSSVDDPNGVRAVLSVPVQVGEDTPILRCPDEPIEIAQDQSIELDIAALCHVWTPTPDDLARISFDADWQSSVDGLSIIEPSGPTITVGADADATPGIDATMLVSSGDSDQSELRFVVVEAPPPSLDPIRIADLRAGESRTVDLARYLRAGVSRPEPTVVEVSQLTDLDVRIAKDGDSGVTITTGDEVDGRAEFEVVMSDVSGSSGPERQVRGRIVLEILDAPDAPTAPVPGNAVRDQEVLLTWRAPDANGSPVDRYRLKGNGGVSQDCGSTTCEVTGLTNGQDYRFQVQAHNAVGWSEWSPQSAVATPDAKPGRVGPIELVREGDTTLSIRWTPPTTQTSAIKRYHVSYPGGSAKTTSKPSITITGLDNNRQYAFTVAAENDFDIGESRTSATFQSVGPPGTPAAPTITDQQTPGDTGAVTLTWPAVNPNGPTPVLYTVLRNGTALPTCTAITATQCDNAGMAYDGTVYQYAVRATNKNGDGKTTDGPPASWSAVGKPATWGSWTVGPTGQNAQGTATFEVPASRGGQSRVRVYVAGGVAKEFDGRGPQTQSFGTPTNDGPYAVQLEVCNESGACERSTTQNVQTYGPLTNSHVLSVKANVDHTKVSWTVTVDANGDPATVRVRSGERDQSFNANGVDVSTFTTSTVDIGYSTTENVTVTISDTSPNRGTGTKTGTVRTEDPPPPTAR